MLPNKVILPTVLIQLIKNQRYGVEYQPIVSITTQEVFAYEALARFFDEQNQKMRPDPDTKKEMNTLNSVEKRRSQKVMNKIMGLVRENRESL